MKHRVRPLNPAAQSASAVRRCVIRRRMDELPRGVCGCHSCPGGKEPPCRLRRPVRLIHRQSQRPSLNRRRRSSVPQNLAMRRRRACGAGEFRPETGEADIVRALVDLGQGIARSCGRSGRAARESLRAMIRTPQITSRDFVPMEDRVPGSGQAGAKRQRRGASQQRSPAACKRLLR